MKNILVFSLLTVMVSCNDFEIEYMFDSEIENKFLLDTTANYQSVATHYAAKGDYKNALKSWDLAVGTSQIDYTQSQIDSINRLYKKVNAINYITEVAKQSQVLIINEAHHSSRHRVFTKSLLQKLYDSGYKNIGFEALTNGTIKDASLNTRKYPIQKSGHYIKDPQFGDLIRIALEIGFHVFPYEVTTDVEGGEREIQQAKNIQRVIESRPNEKFLIHCGFGHVLEGNYSDWGKTMAGRLSEFTGIDPLTVNQVEYSEKSNPEFNHPLLKALNLTESKVLIDENDKPMKFEYGESFTDIAVLHPNTYYKKGRPNWLFTNGNKSTQISLKEIDISFPVMVLAYKKGEDIETAVPMDILEVKNKTDLAYLALRKGEYEIVVYNLEGHTKQFKLNIE